MSDIPRYATATTLAGRRRQVWNNRAQMTGPGGLTRAQLTENSQGKIVSLAKSNMAMGLQGGARRRRKSPKKKSSTPINRFYNLRTKKYETVKGKMKASYRRTSKGNRYRLTATGTKGDKLSKFISKETYDALKAKSKTKTHDLEKKMAKMKV